VRIATGLSHPGQRGDQTRRAHSRPATCRLAVVIAASLLAAATPASANRRTTPEAPPPPPPSVSAAPRIEPAPFPSPLRPVRPLGLRLPTDNHALFDNRPEEFYMGVDRPINGKTELVWQGGQYGFVRNPVKLGEETFYVRFHEGLDIAPTVRDNRGEPLDLVRAIADGRVVFINATPGASNYGIYVVVEHDWGYGAFYSLYAHLMRIDAELGRPVRAGQTLGRLGYTGSGLDRRRAHLHLELNMMLSDTFEAWHQHNNPAAVTPVTPYHGHNLAGLDLAALYHAHLTNPNLTLPEFLASQEPYFRVLAPAGPRPPSLLRRYPWLVPHAIDPAAPPACPAYEITFTASGLPLAITPSDECPPYPVVIAAIPFHGRHSWRTSDRLGGTGTAAELTAKGIQYVRLLTEVP